MHNMTKMVKENSKANKKDMTVEEKAVKPSVFTDDVMVKFDTEAELTTELQRLTNEDLSKMRGIKDMDKIDFAIVNGIFEKIKSDHKKAVAAINDTKVLEAQEQELMAFMDENDKYIKERMYEMPKSLSFGGKVYDRRKIGVIINKILDKVEVEWRYVLGMYDLYNFWKSDDTALGYMDLNNTLQSTGMTHYKGHEEWESCTLVNEYFKQMHGEFQKDFAWNVMFAELHNDIISRIDQIKQMNEPISRQISGELMKETDDTQSK